MSDYLRRVMADEGGSVTVERFMQEALYHPEHGYYARNVQTVGRSGDFSTSATLHPALGQAIARWLRAHQPDRIFSRRGAKPQREDQSAKTDSRFSSSSASLRLCVRIIRGALGTPWHVIELGAGTGELAAGVLASLGWLGRRGLRYHIVEVSAGLREQQQERLGRRARWHEDLASAVKAADGRALIFSNEFVDAFPCQQLGWTPNGWREVRVRETQTGWETFVSQNQTGQRIERHESYRRWLAGWAPQWREGRMLTIDYGDRWPDLYDRRPNGTLRAYWRHRRIDDAEIFARFGQQDLTADVNFTDLEQWGATHGWSAAPLTSQADFLRAWAPRRTLARNDPALAFLLDPNGAGGAFKALEQWPDASARAGAEPDVHSPYP